MDVFESIESLQSHIMDPTNKFTFSIDHPIKRTKHSNLFESQAEEASRGTDSSGSSDYSNLNEMHVRSELPSESGTHSEYTDLNEMEAYDEDLPSQPCCWA